MPPSSHSRIAALAAATVTVVGLSTATPAVAAPPTPPGVSTAWRNGAFQLDRHAVVSRANVVLGGPNLANTESLPVGNGSLGAAVWAAGGFTAQLNRVDTFPDRKSPGQVTIPGLAKLVNAPDFAAHLDLYDGVLTETGGGLTARVYVRADTDQLVVDVTGADPNAVQTAQGFLWSGRSPQAQASGSIGTLAETWVDGPPAGGGKTFGSLLALTAGGRDVTSSVVDAQKVQVSFKPNADGAFRVVVGSPKWTGGDAAKTAKKLLNNAASTGDADKAHLKWWHDFWAKADPMRIESSDGSGQYLEALRTIYLYQEASLNRGAYPGTQAGVANLFSFSQDRQDWVPADYWFWNLRMQIAANLSSGVPDLNTAFFDLYTSNLSAIEAWTKAKVPGSAGACVPETMRFDGTGYYTGANPEENASCDALVAPTYNSLTYTTGAEVSLWLWQAYQHNGDTAFLLKGYPLMKSAARFLLSIAKVGPDGLLHSTSNAHETQWNVTDPVTNVAAMQALFPVVASAAEALHTDADFARQLRTAATKVPPLPRTDAATHSQVLTPADDAAGQDVIAYSTQPAAPLNNGENLDLEPSYAYGLIGDDSGPLTALAKRSYDARRFRIAAEWNYDGLSAARLGLASEVKTNLVETTKKYQVFPSGMGNLFGSAGANPYNEETGIVAANLNEALVQDYDGLLRIAPAWPSDWNVDGTVSVRHNSKVDVQVRAGVPVTVVLEAGDNAPVKVRNPWPGQSIKVVDADTGRTVVAPTTAGQITVNTTCGHKYLIEKSDAPFTALPFAAVTGTAATSAKHFGPVKIGLDKPVLANSLAETFNNVAVTADDNTGPGNIDGGGASMSATALANVGVTAGGQVSHGGLTFTWPSQSGSGTPDNTVANSQSIVLGGSGDTLGFLVTAAYGTAGGTGTVVYTDGTTQEFTLTSPDWFGGSGDVAFQAAYQNRQGNTTYQGIADVYFVSVPLQAGKTTSRVRLPAGSAAATAGTPSLHVFAMARG
ncbi:hypothetical protein [Umezawaea sp. NPDC059074]|uniref:glycosyl hydrolase family 95 catalytic domain-containing protein n=1 Tax=Umezawaea sp. NPDC059074 TaxID=3346716 RepID=UPI00369F11D9